MHTFGFIYGILLGSLILHHSDNLSKTLQHKSMTAAEGQRLAKLTVDVLKLIQQPDRFQAFYQRVVQDQQHYNLSPPCLPRKRRAP